MAKRTTIEIDEELLAKAKRLLSLRTTRETVEESLRRAIADRESEEAEQADKQAQFLDELESLVDLEVLRSDEMWR